MRATETVPADRIPELRARMLHWRQKARLPLEFNEPSADQILQIHAVARRLRLALPLNAFETRATPGNWLLAQEPKLGPRLARVPRRKTTG
jgi:hypothetical protein